MNRIICSSLLAAAALAACDQSDHTITAQGPYDPQANASANVASVTLPPSITAQRSYRCKDNSLIYIDWYSDGSARVKAARNEAGTPVPAPPEGNVTDAAPSPLQGTRESANITYNGKSCHV